MFFIAYTFKGQVHVFVEVKIVSHSSCRTSAILKYFCPLFIYFFSYFRNSEGQQLGIDVALLRPLYQLYTNMTKQESEPGSILPPVTRALTELFLQVENLAIVSSVTLFKLLTTIAVCFLFCLCASVVYIANNMDPDQTAAFGAV